MKHLFCLALAVSWLAINPAGTLLGQGTNNLHQAISPDGKRIAFESDRDGNSEIYLMDIDGANQIRLTHHEAVDSAPVWSVDGKKILFRSTRESDRHPWPYYAMNLDGSSPERVDDVDDYAEVFRDRSPDGTQYLLFKRGEEKNTDIYLVNADGTGEQRLTDEPAFDSDMSFSPDGSKIVYESILGENVSTAVVVVMDRDGANKVQLAGGTDPKWSPDGTRIVFKSYREDGACCDIYVMDADGGNRQKLAEKGFFHRWVPDGSQIIYFSSISGSYQIYSMDPDGSNKRQLTR